MTIMQLLEQLAQEMLDECKQARRELRALRRGASADATGLGFKRWHAATGASGAARAEGQYQIAGLQPVEAKEPTKMKQELEPYTPHLTAEETIFLKELVGWLSEFGRALVGDEFDNFEARDPVEVPAPSILPTSRPPALQAKPLSPAILKPATVKPLASMPTRTKMPRSPKPTGTAHAPTTPKAPKPLKAPEPPKPTQPTPPKIGEKVTPITAVTADSSKAKMDKASDDRDQEKLEGRAVSAADSPDRIAVQAEKSMNDKKYLKLTKSIRSARRADSR